MRSIYHKYRILEEGQLKGAQIINGADSPTKILNQGDAYVIGSKAYSVKISFLYTISGLTCFLYVLEPDEDLQAILDLIGLG